MKRSWHILILVFLTLPFYSLAQERTQDPIVKSDTLRKEKKLQIIAIPVAFYTPETEFGFGGGGQLFLLGEKSRFRNRISNVLFTGIYTTQKQLIIEALKPEIYLGSGNYFIDASLSIRNISQFILGYRARILPEENAGDL